MTNQRGTMRSARLLALLLLAAPLPALAQEAASQPALSITVENMTAAAESQAGSPREDETARPGDVLRYRLNFTNRTDVALRDVVLSNPIPQTIGLLDGSVRSSRDDVQVEYSADGGQTWAAQPMEEVLVEGRVVQRPIPADRFTHVRWTIRGWVQPRATVTAEYDTRFRLADSAQ